MRQMVFYHTMLQMFKIRQDRKPVYLFDKISKEFQHKTRLATGGGIKEEEKTNSDERKKSFIPQAISSWNSLPVSLRCLTSVKILKKEMKTYVKNNVKIN